MKQKRKSTRKRPNYIGQRFSKLLVLEMFILDGKTFTKCICDCGTIKNIRASNLVQKRPLMSCGCLIKNNGKISAEKRKLPTKELKLRCLFRDYKRNAIARNLEFNLKREELYFLCEQNCFYCGKIPSNLGYQFGKIKEDHDKYLFSGIDRIDNNIGYALKNCIPCCKFCNVMKMEHTQKDFFNQIELIYNKHIKDSK